MFFEKGGVCYFCQALPKACQYNQPMEHFNNNFQLTTLQATKVKISTSTWVNTDVELEFLKGILFFPLLYSEQDWHRKSPSKGLFPPLRLTIGIPSLYKDLLSCLRDSSRPSSRPPGTRRIFWKKKIKTKTPTPVLTYIFRMPPSCHLCLLVFSLTLPPALFYLENNFV